MKGYRLSRGRSIVVGATLAVWLGGCSALWTRPSRHFAPPPEAEFAYLYPAHSAGDRIYDKWCSDCHSTADEPGSMALQRKYRGAVPAILTQRTDLQPAFVEWVVRHGEGFMPTFRQTEISDADLALLAAYLARPPGRSQRVMKRPRTEPVVSKREW
jgi:mono/diheme cytochrome c family protein